MKKIIKLIIVTMLLVLSIQSSVSAQAKTSQFKDEDFIYTLSSNKNYFDGYGVAYNIQGLKVIARSNYDNPDVKTFINNKISYLQNYLSKYKCSPKRIEYIVNQAGVSYGINEQNFVKYLEKHNSFSLLLSEYHKQILQQINFYTAKPYKKVDSDNFSYKKWENGFINPTFANKMNNWDNTGLDYTPDVKRNTSIPLYNSLASLKNDDKYYSKANKYIGNNRSDLKKNRKMIGLFSKNPIKIKKYNKNIFIIKYNNRTYYVPKKVSLPWSWHEKDTAFEKYNSIIKVGENSTNKNNVMISLITPQDNDASNKVIFSKNSIFSNQINTWIPALSEGYSFNSVNNNFKWQVNASDYTG
ncbi:hypothetical protein MOO46_05525 [Apilactobacillus apisilvae]|uniref:Uncharacterized protein n=1 Tax=Apilactobacillus apisilvae TaxID=2923364 RepID=A0ABY4PFX3_9LACO|nr:hypothetical protein [Apilactobacillus apisilvae]UQS84708.1 hypothetical protein MOO46_05525 [Apilactobacillus apisilvae]